MPINKFGQYLNRNDLSSPFSDKVEGDVIDCNGKRIQHVEKGYYKRDCVTLEQLDSVSIQCLKKIKDNTRNLNGFRVKLKSLEERFKSTLPLTSKPVEEIKRIHLSPLPPTAKPDKDLYSTPIQPLPHVVSEPIEEKNHATIDKISRAKVLRD